MTIKEMRTMLGLSQQAFGDKYGIPFRTIQNWEGGQRKCPEYVRALLERVVREDYKEIAPYDEAIKKQFEDKSIDGIINNRFL